MSQQKKDKSSRSCFRWGFGCLGIFILFLSLSMNGVLTALLVIQSVDMSESYSLYNETILQKSNVSEDKIVVIHIQDTIMHESGEADIFGAIQPSAQTAIKQLEQAQSDQNVKAVVLNVNSPGGSVSASDVLYNEVLDTIDVGIPVIAYFGEVAASGAYYISAPASVIVAEPSSLVGSIGVIMGKLNVTGLFELLGLEQEVFKSGENKDFLSSTRDTTEEEREIIAGLIEDSKDRFVDIVRRSRSISESDEVVVFDGRIFSATQALELGLVDEIGYFEDAVISAAVEADIVDYSLVEYDQPLGFASLFSAYFTSRDKLGYAIKQLQVNDRPQLLYLWR